jgi:hypothetical protein
MTLTPTIDQTALESVSKLEQLLWGRVVRRQMKSSDSRYGRELAKMSPIGAAQITYARLDLIPAFLMALLCAAGVFSEVLHQLLIPFIAIGATCIVLATVRAFTAVAAGRSHSSGLTQR